jgi:cytoskeletal protein RodZ
MQTNQGFATINYVFNDSQEVENNISNNAMENEDSQNQKNSQNSQNSQTPILGISVGIFGLIAVMVLFMMKKRNLNDDDDDFDEMNDYDELKNSFNEPNNEPINESISETNQINENDRKPSFDFEGDINEDGWEICEYPRGSNIWWWKDYENESWILWE